MEIGSTVMARLESGCIFGTLVHKGRTRAALLLKGNVQKTWVPVDALREWPPPKVDAPTRKVKRGK
jgi:hypothetical protein